MGSRSIRTGTSASRIIEAATHLAAMILELEWATGRLLMDRRAGHPTAPHR